MADKTTVKYMVSADPAFKARCAFRDVPRPASLLVLLEVNGVPVWAAVGTSADDANDADWLRCVKSLTP
jgi:hypothetical protein